MKNALSKISNSLTKVAGKTKFKVEKYSPEILLAVGVVGFVGTVIVACRATLKADEVLDKHADNMEKIEEAKRIVEEEPETLPEDLRDYDVKREKMIAYRDTAIGFAKLYWPTVALGAVSLGCILASRNILHKRYVTALSAYTALSEAFTEYRKRVSDELGKDMDRHFRYGTEKVTKVVDIDEKGKVTEEEVEAINSSNIISETAVVFDETNPNWDHNPNFSLTFLRAQEQYANNILHNRGHIFLNEVYDMLGFDHTPIGALVGWVDGLGDGYVDFGLYNLKNEKTRAFINGKENVILLDFNHDGKIWDKI